MQTSVEDIRTGRICQLCFGRLDPSPEKTPRTCQACEDLIDDLVSPMARRPEPRSWREG